MVLLSRTLSWSLLGLADEVLKERLPRVALDFVLGIEKAQGRRGDDRLFERHGGILLRRLKVRRGINLVLEWACGQPRQLTAMSVCEGNCDPVGAKIPEPVYRVGGEARFSLLPVRNDWGPRRLELHYRVPDGGRI